jgi:hypothetical protein
VPKPEPEPEPEPEWKIVVSDKKTRLPQKQAVATVDEILHKVKANPRYRLTIQWTLEEGPQ